MATATLPLITSKALLALVLGLGVILFAGQMSTILRLIWAGRPGNAADRPWLRFYLTLATVFGQTRVLRHRAVGLAHVTIFYGFLVIGLGTTNVLWRGFFEAPIIPSITESPYFLTVQDIFAVLVMLGVGASACRRYLFRPAQVRNSLASTLILILIFLLMVTLLVLEAVEFRLGTSVASPMAASLSLALRGLGRPQVEVLHIAAWWSHVLLLAGFLVFIPYSKHAHILFCPVSEFLRSLPPKGRLRSIDLDSSAPIGVGTFSQFTRKQLVDLFACTECGRCLQYCPSYASGGPLTPRQMILDLRNGLLARGRDAASVADAVGRDAIWACTTCRACQEHCPVQIEHVDKIVDARRYLLENEKISLPLSRALEGLSLLGNPQMLLPGDRIASFAGLEIPRFETPIKPEIVYWLGCAGGYEPKAQEIAAAMIKILRAAGVDFAILGPSESCCGDPARRVGEEGLFQELVGRNIENMRRLGVDRVLTTCPHCYNTFKNEYPEFGATFSAVNHSNFILELLAARRIELTRPFDQPITFHDPCYLGRYNDIYGSPRDVLSQVCKAGVLEMPRNRDRSFCCGGGGGQMYLETITETRPGRLRFAEAKVLPVSTLATACPFCKIILDDAAQYEIGAQKVRVKDIAELVCECAQL